MMVKRGTLVWNYFKKIEINGKKYGICHFCGAKYLSHAGKMRKHLWKCYKCPEDIKEQFKEVVNFSHKKNIKHNIISAQDCSNETKEEVDDYKYFITETDPNLFAENAESLSGAHLNVEVEQSPEDHYELFGKFIASEIRNLKSEQLQRKAKKTILQTIMDLYSEDGVVTID